MSQKLNGSPPTPASSTATAALVEGDQASPVIHGDVRPALILAIASSASFLALLDV